MRTVDISLLTKDGQSSHDVPHWFVDCSSEVLSLAFGRHHLDLLKLDLAENLVIAMWSKLVNHDRPALKHHLFPSKWDQRKS